MKNLAMDSLLQAIQRKVAELNSCEAGNRLSVHKVFDELMTSQFPDVKYTKFCINSRCRTTVLVNIYVIEGERKHCFLIRSDNNGPWNCVHEVQNVEEDE